MRSTRWTGILLNLTALLASCGGADTTSTTAASPPISATCDSTTLWAAHPITSGRFIPDQDSTGISVSWDNQNCSLRSISSATLAICLSHPQPTDLVWTITPPGWGAPLTLAPPADWNTSGSPCDNKLPGKLQRLDLLTTVATTGSTRGNWTLHVKDQALGDTGTLNQWRILLVGST